MKKTKKEQRSKNQRKRKNKVCWNRNRTEIQKNKKYKEYEPYIMKGKEQKQTKQKNIVKQKYPTIMEPQISITMQGLSPEFEENLAR